MALFDIQNLTFAYPDSPDKKVLNNVSLKVEKGEYVTICGKSGCGKTTLLKHLKTVLTPFGKRSGRIFFDDKDLNDVSHKDQSSKIGFVMQNPDSQIVTDKVWHELAFGLENLGIDQKVMRVRVAEMASYFGIQSWFHKSTSELSGGQKQLLNLASIMAMQPIVLILDEPTSQLDPIAASDFLNTVKKINLELGTTILLTEHRLEDVLHASDRAIVMEDGKIIGDDTPRAIGNHLKKQDDDMFLAMPAPMQIYYGAKQDAVQDLSPLTVREGRSWLSDDFSNIDLVKSTLPETSNNLSDEIAIKMHEVWFRYEKESDDVLCGMSLEVPKASLYGIVGGNGTGKSTALKAICNITKPYRGKILLNGKKVSSYSNNELFTNNVAMLPQDPQSLFVKKSVEEDLLEMVNDDVDSAKNKIQEVAELCGLTKLLSSHPYDLSGGEQQRAAFAKVLLTNPKILLLDEPTKGFDNFFKSQFADILDNLKANGVTILMVSHDIEFCAKYADVISMMFDGNIVTSNTPRTFFSNNSFYTTSANRMSRHIFENAITADDVIQLYRQNMQHEKAVV